MQECSDSGFHSTRCLETHVRTKHNNGDPVRPVFEVSAALPEATKRTKARTRTQKSKSMPAKPVSDEDEYNELDIMKCDEDGSASGDDKCQGDSGEVEKAQKRSNLGETFKFLLSKPFQLHGFRYR